MVIRITTVRTIIPYHSFPPFTFYLQCFSPERRFGFANPEALRAGQTGIECRGEEHDITLVWSLTSGKRLVLADGHEVHFSNSRSNDFDYSWTMKGNHILKITAHATAPLSPTPGYRQYDFFVNGMSFFGFPKVFRLGLHPSDPRGQVSPNSQGPNRGGVGGPRHSATNIANLEAPGNQDEVRGLFISVACRACCRLYDILVGNAHLFFPGIVGGSIFAGGNPSVSER